MPKRSKLKKPSMRKLLAQWADEVKERDGYRCRMCGSDKSLNAHHILPKRGYVETRLDITNGITLCPSCHRLGKNAAHQNCLFFSVWLREKDPDTYDYLVAKMCGSTKDL